CADLGRAPAGGVEGADDRADAGAGDAMRAQAELVQGLEHGDVRQPLRPAAAERQPDAQLVAPHATEQRTGGGEQKKTAARQGGHVLSATKSTEPLKR